MTTQGTDTASAAREHLAKIVLDQGGGLRTNMTKNVHRTSYPAISPTRPELSQEGRTVLITGGGTGIGLATAKAFTQAGAQRVIILGRRTSVLANAEEEIQAEADKAGKTTQVLARACDVTDKAAVMALWEDLKTKGVEVDVLVLNAAKFGSEGSLLDTGADTVWSALDANVRGPLLLAEVFSKQGGDRPKNVVNVATQNIHQFTKEDNIMSYFFPDYSFTKNSGTLAMQLIAEHSDPEVMQVISFHPGVVYTGVWQDADVPETFLPFDDSSLSASAAVWLASPEARFLHGRFIWASWDVDELKTGELRKRIDEDVEFLKLGVHGLTGSGNRKW